LREVDGDSRCLSRNQVEQVLRAVEPADAPAMSAAMHWVFTGGMKSVFLQDANSVILKTPDLVAILNRLTGQFPEIERITSYARSHTIALKKDDESERRRRAPFSCKALQARAARCQDDLVQASMDLGKSGDCSAGSLCHLLAKHCAPGGLCRARAGPVFRVSSTRP